jgi:hypothetical protein
MCGSEFTGRTDARYCGPTCRQRAHRGRWQPEENLILIRRVRMLANDDRIFDREKPALRASDNEYVRAKFTELRDALFPNRSVDAVYLRGWMIAAAMGLDSKHEPTKDVASLVDSFNRDPIGWSRLAANLELLQQVDGWDS